jgi:hypothetical protein
MKNNIRGRGKIGKALRKTEQATQQHQTPNALLRVIQVPETDKFNQDTQTEQHSFSVVLDPPFVLLFNIRFP